MVEILLKDVRTSKKVTTRTLAELSGVSKSYINDIENGTTNPTVETLCKLATALDVGVGELIKCEK